MLLFCVKNISKESHTFELAQQQQLQSLSLSSSFWHPTDFLFLLLFCATRCVVGHKAHKNEWYIVMAYTIFGT